MKYISYLFHSSNVKKIHAFYKNIFYKNIFYKNIEAEKAFNLECNLKQSLKGGRGRKFEK